jgi:hypothetical protein
MKAKISFSFALHVQKTEFSTEKVLGISVHDEIVPDGEDQVDYLRHRVLGELNRLARPSAPAASTEAA